jgi:hypothetical protein
VSETTTIGSKACDVNETGEKKKEPKRTLALAHSTVKNFPPTNINLKTKNKVKNNIFIPSTRERYLFSNLIPKNTKGVSQMATHNEQAKETKQNQKRNPKLQKKHPYLRSATVLFHHHYAVLRFKVVNSTLFTI